MKLNVIKSLVCATVLFSAAYASTTATINHITVYVVRNGDSDRSIHRVFLTEKSAKKYCDTYKDSHNYELEPLVLTE